MTKVDLTQDELKMLVSLISQVTVTVDAAEKLIKMRRKISDAVQADEIGPGKHNK